MLYVLVVIEHHSRRLIHFNVTAHRTAPWTRQQLREVVGYEDRYEYLLHDRDAIFSADLDESIQKLGLRVLKSPPRSPKANAICERVIRTLLLSDGLNIGFELFGIDIGGVGPAQGVRYALSVGASAGLLAAIFLLMASTTIRTSLLEAKHTA